MKTLAMITARGGSKRIPRKNIKEFNGKPIIAYSIEAALGSGVYDDVMVSTDDEEIADICLNAIEHDAIVTGAMARIPVEGTPLGKYPQISEKRLAQVIAVTRLASAYKGKDICVHPFTEMAVQFGANVIETGSVPRDKCACFSQKWHNFDAFKAKSIFERNSYVMCASK